MAAADGGDWKRFANGVATVVIAPPPWRAADGPICIEMLHTEDVLSRSNPQGRRLFLLEEFDSETGVHGSRRYTIPNAKNAALVQEKVFEVETDASVAMSKRDFADAIHDRVEPYAEVGFEGFRRTFELIREAIQAVMDQPEKQADPPAEAGATS